MCRRFLLLLLLLWCSVTVAGEPVLAVVGDSLSAGYGLPAESGWVRLLAQRLEREGYPQRVVNASISGDTSRGGLARLPALLEREQPVLLIIELGGNDGLRGISPQVMRDNLRQMVQLARESGARVLLLGMRLPANYGAEFVEAFHQIYYEVAEAESVPLVPFFLQDVALQPDLMQADGIHPNARAQPRLLDAVWPHLTPLLEPPARATRGD